MFDEIVSDHTFQPVQDIFGNYVGRPQSYFVSISCLGYLDIQSLFEHGT
jgi:hypothetical protein